MSLLILSVGASVAPAALTQTPATEFEEIPLAQIIQRQCAAPLPATEPLDLNLLDAASVPPAPIITRNTISQQGITNPSLWWAAEQFGGKLLDNWLAYPAADGGRVDLVVNRQFWSLLNYLERYQFLNEFGLVAQDYRYNIRVFNPQGAFLAAYTCTGESASSVCRICLDSTVRAGGN
ncbi:hypothetical protein [Microcoleus sp. FACHB-68]|uniref:hypothetical protein n=1 Tax=Microcoleus sp. FACHB-68 TaxID=2692826 RepID=UPI0016872186|nr:hypothetical protein [Microcoleus sp. FACHB-68]